MSEKYSGVKRSGLSFRGEDTKDKKKRRHQKEVAKAGEEAAAAAEAAAQGGEASSSSAKLTSLDVPLIEGSGRIVTSQVHVNGFETKFKEEIETGDTILVHHPTSLEVEKRVVVGVMAQRSLTLDQAFSKDISSTTEYHIRKDSLKLKQKAQAQMQEEGEEGAEALQDAASRELQKQLEKKLKKQAKTVVVREKSGMWGYKLVTKKLDKASTAEERLDERCKQGRDKYCF
mmetsp:Transcript_33435/g.50578  ORF Transcript_33435/g.50578 Transcript_33435/m.50578 type:complete len:230 (-) Transcript_33435:393-1082(-)|eukprot:CAMPEP_0206463472 /NCGR_PEP_ID=MMETSP0324_2-20121206/26627_1 /ASSEMBLY_ACC=CAM_ASM_000836 /TAXON_ID=2866 /ORGANISM="Crypthecodinium cohnii, Strain Seligo" /LENGTH=229 /DNA_ID=CAMNT_0053935891 /DNA_START=62 /DNA_END=751 /DNA_ORIENTATION=+